MSEPPKYDPVELAREGLTEAEADDLREGLAEVDRGETVPLDQVRAELLEELDALAAIEDRRAKRAG